MPRGSADRADCAPSLRAMSTALARIERMRLSSTRSDVVDAIWDLRDLAYDHPKSWQGFTAELLFQALAEEADRAPSDAVDWDGLATLLAASLTKVVTWADVQDH
jgi:hypothetical protein